MVITILVAIIAAVIGYKIGEGKGNRKAEEKEKALLLSIPGLEITRPSSEFLHSEQQSAREVGKTRGDNQVEWLGTTVFLYGEEPPFFQAHAKPYIVAVDTNTFTGDWTYRPKYSPLPSYRYFIPPVEKRSRRP